MSAKHTDIQTLHAAAERITAHNIQLRAFLLRLLDPDDLGWGCSNEVRELAAMHLNMPHLGRPSGRKNPLHGEKPPK